MSGPHRRSVVLALVGLRCSGKTTVGRALAERTGADFVDLGCCALGAWVLKRNWFIMDLGFADVGADFLGLTQNELLVKTVCRFWKHGPFR